MTIDVDETVLRDCAFAVAETGARVVAGATQAPPAPTLPRWMTSVAAASASGGAHDALARLGHRLRCGRERERLLLHRR